MSEFFGRLKANAAKITSKETFRISAFVLGCNAVLGLEMLSFDYGFEQNREITKNGSICLTQAESDAIMSKYPQIGAGVIREYVQKHAALRFVYRAERYAVAANAERDHFRGMGVDASATAPDGIVVTGKMEGCRVNIGVPIQP